MRHVHGGPHLLKVIHNLLRELNRMAASLDERF